MTRIPVLKTHKLFIKGQFPRTESGRSMAITGAGGQVIAHLCRASRKDLRDAVVAARGAQPGWASRSAYNRAQILYRIAEMLESRKAEFESAIAEGAAPAPKKKSGARRAPGKGALTPQFEVAESVDRLVAYAGWADKFAQVLGCNNAVNGPFYNFTVPEPTGVVAAVAPDVPPLLALISLVAPALCAGSAVVALAAERNPIPACLFAEVCATSDVPAGVVNILTGYREELVPQIASHRDIDAVHAANLSKAEAETLRAGAAENVKRVTVRSVEPADWFNPQVCEDPWWIERFVEMKTIWHPASA